MSLRAALKSTGGVLALALISACASPPALAPVASSEGVRFTVEQHAPSGQAVPVRSTAVREGLSFGIGAGGLAGGLWGLSCGPFAVLCVPLGAAAGMVTGGAAGAAVGATGLLSKDKAEQVAQRVLRVQQQHPVLDDLRRQLDERAQKHWPGTVPATALHQVRVEVQTLEVSASRSEQLSFALRVLVSQTAPGAAAPPRVRQKMYVYVSPPNPLAAWLDERGDFLEVSLTAACQQIAAQIVADLALR